GASEAHEENAASEAEPGWLDRHGRNGADVSTGAARRHGVAAPRTAAERRTTDRCWANTWRRRLRRHHDCRLRAWLAQRRGRRFGGHRAAVRAGAGSVRRHPPPGWWSRLRAGRAAGVSARRSVP